MHVGFPTPSVDLTLSTENDERMNQNTVNRHAKEEKVTNFPVYVSCFDTEIRKLTTYSTTPLETVISEVSSS